jgi:hypothetical protein
MQVDAGETSCYGEDMKRWIAVLALGLAGIAIAYFASDASARARPTFYQAHLATWLTLKDYADIVDGRLVVGPCRHHGSFTTVCRARIDGPLHERYRILVTGTPARNFLVTVRAR